MDKTGIRIALFFVTIGSIILLPWWFYVALLLAQVLYIRNYFEIIFFGFFIDMLYSTKYPFPYIGVLVSTIILISLMFIRTKIRT